MTPRRRSHWWVTAGAVAVTVATVLSGVIPFLDYLHTKETTELQQHGDWAARQAVIEYRMDEAERDIKDGKDQERHDIDQLSQRCRP